MLKKEGWHQLTSGHPWVRIQHLKNSFPFSPAGLINWGEHWFFYSPKSQLPLRRLGPNLRNWLKTESSPQFIQDNEVFEKHFLNWLTEHFSNLAQQKLQLVQNDQCFRWIFSENDLLPGLIVDVFSNTIVCQILSAPMESFWPTMQKALAAAFKTLGRTEAEFVLLRNSKIRQKEGLAIVENEQEAKRICILWNSLKWHFAPGGPQKTGSYLDQRDNHTQTLQWAEKLGLKTAWDLCSFEGGFGLHLAKAKRNVLAVDQSETALSWLEKNALENNCNEYIRTEKADVFDWIRKQSSGPELIVLDPPSFVKDSSSKWGALKGFKDLNLRAMKLLPRGGMLVSCSCSHHISENDFEDMLRSAAHDVRRDLHILERKGPSNDHSPQLSFPEGRYLQAWYMRML